MSMNDPDRDAAASAAFTRLQERRQAGEPAPPEPEPPREPLTHEAPVINPKDWAPKEPEPPRFEGKQSAREAADELQRRRSQMTVSFKLDPDAVPEKKGLSAREAAERVNFSRKLQGAHELWQRTHGPPDRWGAHS